MDPTSQKTSKKQALFLKRLAEAREHLLASIAGLDPALLCREPVMGDWNIKDIFVHLVAWNEEFRSDIEIILQGRHPGLERQISGEDDFDAWNRQVIAQKAGWSWERMQAEFERDYAETVQLIVSLTPGEYRQRGVTPWKRAAIKRPAEILPADTESVETLVSYHWRHLNQHARMIEKWRKGRAG